MWYVEHLKARQSQPLPSSAPFSGVMDAAGRARWRKFPETGFRNPGLKPAAPAVRCLSCISAT